MTRLIIGVVTILLTFAVFGIYDARQQADALSVQVSQASHTRDSLKARLAEAIMTQAPARIDTVRIVTQSVGAARDSLLAKLRDSTAQLDTVEIVRFIFRTDTLRAECLKCAALLDTIRLRYADEKRATETFISFLQRDLREAKREHWYDRLNVSCGYGPAKIGADLKMGTSCIAGVRVWP